MENQTNNEPVVINKWHIRLKKWLKRVVVLGVIYGFVWLFLPLSCAKIGTGWSNVTLGQHKTMKDLYYVNIGGITYAKDTFYILLNKPYLFNNHNGYIYASKDLINWDEEASLDNLVGSMSSLYNEPNRYYVDSNGHTMFARDDTDVSNDALPRMIGNNCYIIYLDKGFMSTGCSSKWTEYDYLNKEELDLFSKCGGVKTDAIDGACYFVNDKYKVSKDRSSRLQQFFCLPRLSSQNILAYQTLDNIIKTNKLDILIDGSHTTYGDGKYVGIFYKNKQYYFIISTDGVHYEITLVPEELISSLAIKLFN